MEKYSWPIKKYGKGVEEGKKEHVMSKRQGRVVQISIGYFHYTTTKIHVLITKQKQWLNVIFLELVSILFLMHNHRIFCTIKNSEWQLVRIVQWKLSSRGRYTQMLLLTFSPVALIFSANWSTATLLGAQTKTWWKIVKETVENMLRIKGLH